MLRRVTQALGFLTGLAAVGTAAPIPGAPFTDLAVLQRDRVVPVWGTANPGERIRVSFRQVTADTVTGTDRIWRVNLPPLVPGPASDLVITGDTTVTLHGVVVGDVWLISGQSNAEWPLSKSDATDSAALSTMAPWLRTLRVPHRVSHEDESRIGAHWSLGTSPGVQDISAVGFCFVRHLYPQGGIPIGLIQVAYGGTVIEAWLSPRALQQAPAGPAALQRWNEVLTRWPVAEASWLAAKETWARAKAEAERTGSRFVLSPPRAPIGPGHPSQVSGLHHGMLAPLLPSALKGVIWYQGESNVGRPEEYSGLLAALIADWRRRFEQEDLPFLLVQLPNYRDPRDAWWKLRDAQAQVARETPGCHLAVTIDQGASRDKHPRNKDEVGRRLALLARRHVFAESVEAEAPSVVSALREGSRVRLEFLPTNPLLRLRPAAPASISFELAGSDGIFHSATARLAGRGVSVESPEVSEPSMVRYLQHNDPLPILFTATGLPVAPFQQKATAAPGHAKPKS